MKFGNLAYFSNTYFWFLCRFNRTCFLPDIKEKKPAAIIQCYLGSFKATSAKIIFQRLLCTYFNVHIFMLLYGMLDAAESAK
jgi:hypothetical protein